MATTDQLGRLGLEVTAGVGHAQLVLVHLGSEALAVEAVDEGVAAGLIALRLAATWGGWTFQCQG